MAHRVEGEVAAPANMGEVAATANLMNCSYQMPDAMVPGDRSRALLETLVVEPIKGGTLAMVRRRITRGCGIRRKGTSRHSIEGPLTALNMVAKPPDQNRSRTRVARGVWEAKLRLDWDKIACQGKEWMRGDIAVGKLQKGMIALTEISVPTRGTARGVTDSRHHTTKNALFW
jgi:hypothetical protein